MVYYQYKLVYYYMLILTWRYTMAKHTNLSSFVIAALERNFAVRKNDIGKDARLARFGMEFRTKSFEVEGIGHLCTMRMKAFGGLMKMETVVIAPTGVDAPLFNVDWVWAFGKETLIAELYDTQLEPWPEAKQAEFEKLREKDADLEDAVSDPHWYDEILYPCSYHKVGKKRTERFNRAAEEYIGVYCAQLAELPPCDRGQKSEKVQDFARKLASNGGSAVNMMTKLFGEETAKRVIIEHMYGA